MSAGSLMVGTSGFAFKEWKGTFYPEGLPDKKMLAHYSTVLPSVEINYSFRRLPSESVIAGWREQAAGGFRFTLKAPQRITHFKRLAGAEEDVEELVRRVRLLGDKLGAVLFQLPPTLRFDAGVAGAFLAALPPVCRFALEPRHESWRTPEAAALLEGHGVALCGADSEDSALGEIPRTAPHAYLRLRRESYGDGELDGWARKVAAVLRKGADVYCYFKHEGGGVGPAYAAALREQALELVES